MAKVYVTRTGDVAELVISAPPLNLFDSQLATDLEDALDEVIAQCWPGGTTPGKSPLPGEPIPPDPRWARAVLLRAEGKSSLLRTALGSDVKGKISPLIYLASIALAFGFSVFVVS